MNLEIIIIFMLVEEKIISSLEEVLLENNFDYNKTINDFVNVLNNLDKNRFIWYSTFTKHPPEQSGVIFFLPFFQTLLSNSVFSCFPA